MDSVELVTDFPEELNKEIRNFDVLYDICSVDNPFSRIPDLFDVDQILSICGKIKYMIDEIDSTTKN